MKVRFMAFSGQRITGKKFLLILIGSMIFTFGITNIHQRTLITEGGIIGLVLLLENTFSISPAYLTPLLDILSYASAFKYLGFDFIKLSAIATALISCFYKFWELFPPLLPNLSAYPLFSAILGGLFVGTGIGLIIRQGGSGGGDDALALTLSRMLRWRLSRCYLFTDVVVLILSLTYIPVHRICFSLITVSISSLLIDRISDIKPKTHSNRFEIRDKKKSRNRAASLDNV